MKTTRLLAAAAVLVVTGSALASAPSDGGTAPTSGANGINPASGDTSFANSLRSAAVTYAAPGHEDMGTLWVLTGIAYEFPSTSSTSFEVGVSWYGIGGGINFYPGPSKSGLMWSARVGVVGDGFAVNGAINYVGSFSPNLKWRLGVGVEYVSANEGFWNGFNSTFPFVEASLGFHF
jgi:hypothetical protein